MDLLGRKAKKLTEQLLEAGEKLVVQRDELNRLAALQREVIANLSADLQSRESLLSDLIRENAELGAEVATLRAEKLPKFADKPIHVPEEEQEIEWQVEQGLLNAADAAHILKELEFQNTEIDIDPDYRPRPDLTY